MNPRYKTWIILFSIVIPLVVAILFGVKIETSIDFTFLPRIYAGINLLTFFVLIGAWMAIRNKNQKLHRRLVFFALVLSTFFLVLYILYHMTTDSTAYGGEGVLRYIYFFILISHIVLSVLVIPLVLISLGWALSGVFKSHRKIARIAMPIWIYVAITGVIVYAMISPYYN
jgi:putative membrane protein